MQNNFLLTVFTALSTISTIPCEKLQAALPGRGPNTSPAAPATTSAIVLIFEERKVQKQ